MSSIAETRLSMTVHATNDKFVAKTAAVLRVNRGARLSPGLT